MKNQIHRDQKKRKLYLKYEITRLVYKSCIHDLNIPKDIRYVAAQQLNKLPRNSSRGRIKNRCILTGRGHSILNHWKLSRIKFRELASKGLLMGVTKSSW